MTMQEGIRPARIWALGIAALILVMVVIGGATRLTESGLSITEWKPITGVLPPLSDVDWAKEFDAYKKIPQYAAMNADMTLDGFKTIFWWEWAHRLLARILGAAFIIPGLSFWLRGKLRGEFGKRIAVATMLLAFEPIVGWWMVSSGLSERTEVAQERLAIHLLIAAAAFAALIHAAVGAGAARREKFRQGFIGAAWGLVALLFVQLGLGALAAGLRAGRIYNDWPLMGGRFVPSEAFSLTPWARSLFDDPATAQFDHRLVAYVALIFAIALAVWAARSAPGTRMAARTKIVAVAACVQVLLGIVTLVLVVPLHAALAHQAVALILFGVAVANASATERDGAAAAAGGEMLTEKRSSPDVDNLPGARAASEKP